MYQLPGLRGRESGAVALSLRFGTSPHDTTMHYLRFSIELQVTNVCIWQLKWNIT